MQATWSLQSGALPPGLALSPQGQLTGTPTTEGSLGLRHQSAERQHARLEGVRTRRPPALEREIPVRACTAANQRGRDSPSERPSPQRVGVAPTPGRSRPAHCPLASYSTRGKGTGRWNAPGGRGLRVQHQRDGQRGARNHVRCRIDGRATTHDQDPPLEAREGRKHVPDEAGNPRRRPASEVERCQRQAPGWPQVDADDRHDRRNSAQERKLPLDARQHAMCSRRSRRRRSSFSSRRRAVGRGRPGPVPARSIQPATFQLPLVDPQVARQIGLIAANLLDEPCAHRRGEGAARRRGGLTASVIVVNVATFRTVVVRKRVRFRCRLQAVPVARVLRPPA